MGCASAHHYPQARRENQCHGGKATRSHKEGRAWESEKRVQDFPSGPVVKACQCMGLGFNPWSRKIPHALEQLSHRPQLLSPCSRARAPEPVLYNKRSLCSEKPLSLQPEKPSCSNKDPEQP